MYRYIAPGLQRAAGRGIGAAIDAILAAAADGDRRRQIGTGHGDAVGRIQGIQRGVGYRGETKRLRNIRGWRRRGHIVDCAGAGDVRPTLHHRRSRQSRVGQNPNARGARYDHIRFAVAVEVDRGHRIPTPSDFCGQRIARNAGGWR